jgi:hypothetical protein
MPYKAPLEIQRKLNIESAKIATNRRRAPRRTGQGQSNPEQRRPRTALLRAPQSFTPPGYGCWAKLRFLPCLRPTRCSLLRKFAVCSEQFAVGRQGEPFLHTNLRARSERLQTANFLERNTEKSSYQAMESMTLIKETRRPVQKNTILTKRSQLNLN